MAALAPRDSEVRGPGAVGWVGAWLASRYLGGVILITTLGLAMRALWIDSVPPLWRDEAFTAVVVRRPLGAMLDVVRQDNHPPLDYLLVRLVTLLSTSPWALRTVSVVAGTLAVPLAAWLGRRLAGDAAGLLAALVVATNFELVRNSRDARMYGLADTLVLLAAITLWRALERPDARRLAAYAATVAACLYTHYLTSLALVIALGAGLACVRPRRVDGVKVILAGAAGAVTLVPWLVYALPQLGHAESGFWIAPLTWPVVVKLLWSKYAAIGVVAFWTVGGIVLWLAYRLWRRSEEGNRWLVPFIAASSLMPSGVLLLLSFWKPLYDERYLGLSWALGLAGVGAVLVQVRPWWLLTLACMVFVGSAAYAYEIHDPDFGPLLRPVSSGGQATDLVIVNGPRDYWPVAYELEGVPVSIHVLARGPVPWFWGTAGYEPGTVVATVPAVTGRIYVVNDPKATDPPLPPGFHRVSRTCQLYSCLETFVASAG